jgi:hypothetical protein
MIDEELNPGIEVDDATTEAQEEMELAAALKMKETDEDEPTADKPVEQEASEEKEGEESAETPEAEPAKEKSETPDSDMEERFNREVEARLAKAQQKLVDSIIAKERKREGNALNELREIEIATGLSKDQLKAQGLQKTKAEAMERFAMSEEDAEVYAQQQTENRRYKAERDQIAAERDEERKVFAYNQQRDAVLADPKTPGDLKGYATRWADEINELTDGGKNGINYKLALDLIVGQHYGDIMAERERALEQKFLRNQGTPDKKAAPVTGGGTGPDTVTVTAAQLAMGRRLGLSDKEIKEAYASNAKRK